MCGYTAVPVASVKTRLLKRTFGMTGTNFYTEYMLDATAATIINTTKSVSK